MAEQDRRTDETAELAEVALLARRAELALSVAELAALVEPYRRNLAALERIRAEGRSHVIVASDDPSELVPLEIVEQRYIARVMESVGGNKTLAARILGFDRKTLYRKLERYDADGELLDEPAPRSRP